MTILAYIISNNEIDRSDSESKIAEVMSPVLCLELQRIVHQPTVAFSRVRRYLLQLYILWTKFHYRRGRMGILTVPKTRNIKLERVNIASVITYKHLLAIQHGLQSSAAYICVVENDAIPYDNARHLLCSTLLALRKREGPLPIFVDLADQEFDGSLTHRVNPNPDNVLETIIPPTTRTACAYIINRAFAEALVTYVHERSLPRFLPIDWMLNMALNKMESGLGVLCLRTISPPFRHGSASNEIRSWQD